MHAMDQALSSSSNPGNSGSGAFVVAASDAPTLDNAGWREAYESVLMDNYGRRRLAIVRGQGTRVWAADGKEYIDFFAGISVNNLGHCHPRVVEAIQRQAAQLIHCSNLYYIPPQIELARMLVDHSFADRVVFGNSGAEANEAAIKIARRYNKETRGPGHHEIVTFVNSFHGRTLATLTATGQDKIKTGFDPFPEGFVHAPYNDLAGTRALVTERTGAIMVEPVIAEGGVVPATPEFLRGLRELCDERGLILIFDEVQTGLGRVGGLFGYETYGVEPDVMTIAKSLAGGLAMGAMLCREAIAKAFAPGSHGSTMAGNALTSAAAVAYLTEMIEGDWPARAAKIGEELIATLREKLAGAPRVREVRGRGLLIGIELAEVLTGANVQLACERQGLIVGLAGPQVVRLAPPLNVSEEEVARAVEILCRALEG
jgi:acetylornithine aminotransferase/acetylornithine/N-succinyldiaminopimelate aminotransferase